MSVDQPKPTRKMTDMGPRRMDGFVRAPRPPGAQPEQRTANPASSTSQRPRPLTPQSPPRQPAPQQSPPRSVLPSRPMQPAVNQTVRAAQPVSELSNPSGKAGASKGNSWNVILQFAIGLLVIGAVATAIVLLYTKYYAQ